MKLMNYITLSLLFVTTGILQASSSADRAFIDAAQSGRIEIIDRLMGVVSQKAYDRALREAARNCDMELFNKLKSKASPRGYRKALRSLARRGVIVNPVIVYVPVDKK